MANKVISKIKQYPYIFASICVVLIFFVVSLYVRKTISEAAEEKVGILAVNIAQNNTKVVEGEVFKYMHSLEHLKKLSSFSGFSKKGIIKMLDYMADMDTVIIRAWYCAPEGEFLVKGENNLSLDYKKLWEKLNKKKSSFVEQFTGKVAGNNIGFIRQAVPFRTAEDRLGYIGIDISLKGFHDIIASFSELRSGYITIISDKDIFVLHPDEKMIGKTVRKKDKDNKQKALALGKSFSAEVYSDFLKIDVYRYYTPITIGDKKWLITANVPNIGFKEYVARTSKILLFIALGALFSFIAIILFGILRWRKEFVQRKEAEHQNLSLQLRNEQQKKITIATELENLKSGLNPHFLFNSLTTLKILVNKDANMSKDFAISLANLYRYLLDHENENTVSLRTELEFANDYIYLQKIRFKDGILVEMNIPDNCMDMLIPPVSVQILIENCIKHNVVSMSTPLNIYIYTKHGFLVVENNFNPRHSVESSTGKGQENLCLRYSFLTNKKCEFYIEDDKYIARIPLL